MKSFPGKATLAVAMMYSATTVFAQDRASDSGDSDLGVQYVEEKGAYFGVGLVIAKSKQGISDFNDDAISLLQQQGFGITGGSAELDDSDTSFSLTSGYNFNEYFGAEISYINFGSLDYSARAQVQQTGLNPVVNVTSSAEIKTQGVALSGVGRLPVTESFAVRTRLGLILTKSEFDFRTSVKITDTTNPFRVSRSDSTNDTNLVFSIGGSYSFENQWTVSLDYQILTRTGDDRFLDDIGALTLGVTFRL